jgi:hypothetical protein
VGFTQDTLSSNAELRISLEKMEYLVAEPIFLDIEYINHMPSGLKIAPIHLGWGIRLFNSSGRQWFGGPALYHKRVDEPLEAGQKLNWTEELVHSYGTSFRYEGVTKGGFSYLPPGTYTVYCKLSSHISDSLKFTIHEPAENDSLALKAFHKVSESRARFYSSWNEPEQYDREKALRDSYSDVHDMTNLYSENFYTQLAQFWRLRGYHKKGDGEPKYTKQLHEFYRSYPHSRMCDYLLDVEFRFYARRIGERMGIWEISELHKEDFPDDFKRLIRKKVEEWSYTHIPDLRINLELDKDTFYLGEYIHFDGTYQCRENCDTNLRPSDFVHSTRIQAADRTEYKHSIHVDFLDKTTIKPDSVYHFGSEFLHAWGIKMVHQDSAYGLDYLPVGEYQAFVDISHNVSNNVPFKIEEPPPQEQAAFKLLMRYSEVRAIRHKMNKKYRYDKTLELEKIVFHLLREHSQSVYAVRVLSDFLSTVNWDGKYKQTENYPRLLDKFVTMYPNDPNVTWVQNKEFYYMQIKYGLDSALQHLDRRIELDLSERLTHHALKLKEKYTEK